MCVVPFARQLPAMAGLVSILAACANPADVSKPPSIRLGVSVDPPFHPHMARLQVGANPVLYELGADDFTQPPYAMPSTDDHPVPTSGSLAVRGSLVNEGDTLASGSFTFELQADHDYSVQLNVGSTRESLMNSYCNIDLVAVPVRRPGAITVVPGDTMFIVHGARRRVETRTCE